MSSAECVELLREPVAQEGNLASRASQLAADLRQAMKSGADDIVTVQAVDELFGTLCALYAANAEALERITPIKTGDHAKPTDVLMTATGLLRGAKLELFELGMWQSWSGMK